MAHVVEACEHLRKSTNLRLDLSYFLGKEQSDTPGKAGGL